MTQPHMYMLALVPLVLWRVYKRVQRLTVRQQSRTWRHWTGAVLLPVLLLAFAGTVIGQPWSLGALAAGAAGGAALGLLALRRSRFEQVDGLYFYTPDTYIGLLVSALFIGRLGYRAYEFYGLDMQHGPAFGSSPLTLVLMGLVGGFYASYAIGLLRWRRAAVATAMVK